MGFRMSDEAETLVHDLSDFFCIHLLGHSSEAGDISEHHRNKAAVG
jgi:hypothetical protein